MKSATDRSEPPARAWQSRAHATTTFQVSARCSPTRLMSELRASARQSSDEEQDADEEPGEAEDEAPDV